VAASAPAFVVAGFDGSRGSQAALDVALREARRRRARLLVVSAWHAPSRYYGSQAAPSAALALAEKVREELETKLEEAVAARRGEDGGVEIETRLVDGGAVSVLTKEAANADLLVVGSRGLGGFRKALLGSVSHECAQHASCPVLIVPSSSAPAAARAACS
jgi:nucleotide-binding universal stress UspA family protein